MSFSPERRRIKSGVPPRSSRDAAYRRLAITILGLDVPTLASELQAARLCSADQEQSVGLPSAA
jgi:hypothetical protein